MGLRETPRSLRAYFLVSGTVIVLIAIGGSVLATEHHEVSLARRLALWVPYLTGFVEGFAFIWAGMRLFPALLAGARWIKGLLIASGALMFVEGAFHTAVVGSDLPALDLIHVAIKLAITIYLYRSVVRLSAEAIERAGLPNAPPTATIV